MFSDLQVHVSGGVLQGKAAKSINGKDYVSFLGVPYAEPPVGDLRFKAPVPKKPWTGVRDATNDGNSSCQFDIFTSKTVGDEDCLYLNVYIPKVSDKEDEQILPVMFYFHGGGFVFGSGSSEGFSPDFFMEHDVILVSTNYRLGALGFMCLDTPDVPGNAGLKDQNMALKWVQQNIRAFGGNPDNVTVFGISAGAASIEYHLLSHMSKGLFQKAILQSGSTLNPWARMNNPTRTIGKLLKILGIEENDSQKVYQILKNMEANKLVDASMRVGDDEEHKNGEVFTFTPVVEKTFEGVESFLKKEPLELLEDGLINKVPTITGFCENEGALIKKFLSDKSNKEIDNGNFIDYLPERFKVDRVFFEQSFKEIYTDDDKTQNGDDFLSDLYFLSGVYESLKHRSRFTNTDYFYMFTYDGNINYAKSSLRINAKGAYHGDDTSYLALTRLTDESKATDQDKLVRSRMVKMWTDFAKTGNPTPQKCDIITTEWLPATSHNAHVLEIGNGLKMKKFPFSERMDVWENIYESSINIPRQ